MAARAVPPPPPSPGAPSATVPGAARRLFRNVAALRRAAARLIRAEAAWAGGEVRQEFVLSNLRAIVLFAGALFCALLALAMGGLIAVVAAPAGARVWVAAGLTAGWLAMALILALAARSRLRLEPRRVLGPLEEDLRWAGRLLRRVWN